MDSESFRLVIERKRSTCCSCIPARYVLTFLVFCGLFVIYTLRVNLSVSMVAMVNNSAISDQLNGDLCEDPNLQNVDVNGTLRSGYDFETDGEFLWDTYTQSIILGAFYYGYSLTQLPGGWMSERIGGKWPFGVGILLTSLFTLAIPLAARMGVWPLVAVRVVKGLGEGVTYPAMYAIFSRWAPVKERSLLIALASIGANLGTIVGMPTSAYLCEYGFNGGWPSVFYIFGGLGCLWFVFWVVSAHSRPTLHPRITTNELVYLKQTLGPLKERPPTPWMSILTSVPVWAITVARFASYWGLYTLISELPSYLKNMLKFDMDQNGIVNAIIYTSQSVGMIAGGYFSDLLRSKTSIHINVNRKLFETIGSLGPAACLAAIPFAGCNRLLVVGLITLAQGLYGFNAGGSIPAMVDLAPDFAGTVSGFVLTIGSCAGFVGPMVAGKIMQHGQGMKEWNTIFYITAGIYVFGAVTFLLFGSAEVQPWGCTQEDDDDFLQIRTQSMVSRATTGRRSRTSTMLSDRSDFSKSLIINEIIADKNEPQILKVVEVYKH